MDNISQTRIVIGLVQMSMSNNMAANLETAINGIQKAASRGAKIICLPELFRTPYFCIKKNCSSEYSEELPGIISPTLSKLAKDLCVNIIAGSIYEKTEHGLFNTSLVFNELGVCLGNYRKTHIPHDPAFFEQNYFKPSEDGYKLFETSVNGYPVKIGVLICYDQWFPEAARTLALMGADIIFYPTAIGTIKGVPD